MLIPYGPLINALFIFVGGCIGLVLGSRLPDRIRKTAFQGIGLCVLVLGIKMSILTNSPLVMIFSIILGGLCGEVLRLEDRLLGAGNWFKRRFKFGNPRFTEGMVNTTILFCVGAMAILGSFDEGLRGDRTVVLSKSVLDGFAAIAFASAYGVGVLFSSIAVLIYQGALTVGASLLQPWITPQIMNEIVAVGGVMIIGISLNLMEITKISISNLLPALIIVIALAQWTG